MEGSEGQCAALQGSALGCVLPRVHAPHLQQEWHRNTEPQNGWVGGDLKAHPALSSCHGSAAAQQVRLEKGPSSLAWSACRDVHPQLLWAAVPGPHRPPSKEFLPNISAKYPLFFFSIKQFFLILSLLDHLKVDLLPEMGGTSSVKVA